MNTIDLGNLCSVMTSENYYLTIIENNRTEDSFQITSLQFEVDHGVHNYNRLGELLHEIYPNLTKLTIKQHYSAGMYATSSDFLKFLKLLRLQEFTLFDLQTQFLKHIKPDKILDIMVNNSHYTINYGIITDNFQKKVYQQGNKILTWIQSKW